MVKSFAAALLLVACRDAYDISQPIDLVTSGVWTDAQRADLANATACWNLGFGVDLRTTSTGDHQRDTLEFDELMCLNSSTWAWTASSFESKTMICPFDLPPDAGQGMLFGVLAHELGHVLGIPEEVDDPDAIMGGVAPINLWRKLGSAMFSPVDHALFDRDNADFAQHATCDPIVVDDTGSYSCACR